MSFLMRGLQLAALTVCNILLAILPDSPITRMLEHLSASIDNLEMGLGVLNWLVDVNGIVIIMGIWLTALTAFYAYHFGINVFSKFMGGLKNITSFFGGGE